MFWRDMQKKDENFFSDYLENPKESGYICTRKTENDSADEI